jgi:hypothetical protein
VTEAETHAIAVLLELATARDVHARAETARAWLARLVDVLGATPEEVAQLAGVTPASVDAVLRGGDASGVWGRGRIVRAVKASLRERLRAALGDAYAAAMLAARERAPTPASPYGRPAADASPSDAAADAGPADAGPADAGPADAGPADAGPSDAGRSDAAPSDAASDPRDPVLDQLLALAPADFSRVVANLLVALRHAGSPRQVHVAPADAGRVELIVFEEDRSTGSRLVVQADRRRAAVGVDDVRHLSGLVGPHVDRAMMITTSEFTAEARRFAAPRTSLTLVDGAFLCDAVRACGLGVAELAAPPE